MDINFSEVDPKMKLSLEESIQRPDVFSTVDAGTRLKVLGPKLKA